MDIILITHLIIALFRTHRLMLWVGGAVALAGACHRASWPGLIAAVYGNCIASFRVLIVSFPN